MAMTLAQLQELLCLSQVRERPAQTGKLGTLLLHLHAQNAATLLLCYFAWEEPPSPPLHPKYAEGLVLCSVQVQLVPLPFRSGCQQLPVWCLGRLSWRLHHRRQTGQAAGAHVSSLLVW